MARKQVVFSCLVTVGVVASLFNGCDVEVKQNITIQICTLAPENVEKVDGYCPMRDFVIRIPVCKDVTTTICNQDIVRGITIYPNGTRCMSFDTQHCVASYENHSFDGVAFRRRGVEDGDTCVNERATYVNDDVEAPKEVKCSHVF